MRHRERGEYVLVGCVCVWGGGGVDVCVCGGGLMCVCVGGGWCVWGGGGSWCVCGVVLLFRVAGRRIAKKEIEAQTINNS